jgi:hypothetical protein
VLKPDPLKTLFEPFAAEVAVVPALPPPTVTVYVTPVVIVKSAVNKPPAPPPAPPFAAPAEPPPPATTRYLGETAGVVMLFELPDTALFPTKLVAKTLNV